MMNTYIKIGKIIDTRALRGEVKVYPYTNAVDSFDNIQDVFVDFNSDKEELILEYAKPYKNIMVMKFKGVDDINSVLKYKGEYVYIKNKEMSKLLDEDEYFVEDLKGLLVKDENGNILGKVLDVRVGNVQDLVVVESSNEEWYIPYVDEFILDVDIDNNTMLVKLIDGMR
ncbi:MAG: 16S rRNA processing protein RimM [Clostridiales bacterium]|nr:MAG: 16S rRNA processing protein RimM [Clostridiales bacterium]